MSFFARKPQLFRFLFGALAAALLTLAVLVIYRYGSVPTDENWFADTSSRIYVIKNAAADGSDSLLTGDLVSGVGNDRTGTLEALQSVIRTISPDSVLTLKVQRSRTNRTIKVEVPRKILSAEIFRELPTAVYVIEVIEGGASDRAGMKAGDLILNINGQTFTSAGDADRILRSGQTGKSITYLILRENQLLDLHVTLASFGFPFSLLIMMACGLAFMGLGVFVGLSRPRLVAARLLGVAYLLIGFAVATSTTSRGLGADLIAYLRGYTWVFAFFFGIALLLHSEHYFPKEQPELLTRRWIRIVAYVLAAAATITLLVTNGAGFGTAAIIMGLYFIVVKLIFRKKVSAEYKQLNKPIRVASMIAGAGVTLLLFLLVLVGKASDRTVGYIGVPLLLIPLSYLYTIGRFRLLDMQIRIRRNVQYSFAAVAWTIITIALLLVILLWLPQLHLPLPNLRITGASLEVLDAPMQDHQQTITEKGLLMAAAIGLAFMFRRIGRNGQEYLARKFDRTKYDYRRSSSELAEVMSTKLNMVDLARGIVAKLSELMRLKRAGVLFFRGGKACCCKEGYGFEENEWRTFCLAIPDSVVQQIMQIKGHSSVDYLASPTKEIFQQGGFHVIVPVRSKEKLVGALLLGEKLSESPFQEEDFTFLTGAANQASVAIENAFLYEELAEQDRMKHELEIARRIQLESLPQRTPIIEGLELAGKSIPATEVGGDYFDYLNGSVNKLTIIVGDVSGKGTPAALYMAKVQGIFRSLYGFGLTPKELFVRANALLRTDLERKSFVTAVGGCFDTKRRRVIIARAGHLPVFIYKRRHSRVERLLPRGIGFGLSETELFSSEIEELALQYERGDVFVFVTDGVTEAQRSDREQFGEEKIVPILESLADRHAEEILEGILAAVNKFTSGERSHDDQTIVVAKAT